MSEPVLERSVLERKERDELQTIAKALGAKPPARAKKADLVDLILTTAGITSSPAPEPAPPEPAPAPTGNGRGSGRGNGRAAKVDDASTSEPVEPLDEHEQHEPEAHADSEADGNANTVEAPARADQDHTDRDHTDRDQADQNQADQHQADQHQARNRDQQPRNRDQQLQRDRGEGPRVDDDDPNNRRGRRRRGRDRQGGGPEQFRDRPDEPFTGEPVPCSGLLDLRDEGYGFLRTKGYLPSKDDVYVSVKQVRQFGLRKGDHLDGASRPANRNEKNPALLRIDKVNGKDPDEARNRPRFEDLTPLFPDEKLRLETPGRDTGTSADMTARIVDLISPIGKGQRGLIVSPPKAGKTTVVKQIVQSIERNNPEVHLMVLLVDERPEEVTDMRRSTTGEVIASTFDRPAEEHTALAELTIERAKRLVEEGQDVVIVLDGITRLARAYNLSAPATGRIMSGGVDSGALYPPKKFFGAARNVEEGGSLTILATALIETGSRMDEVIFEEFKGTGNMELRLDRRLAERRVYPAIDVDGSSTRHEELLFDRKQLQQVWKIRRALNALSADGGSNGAALERLFDGLKQYKSNEEFLDASAKA
jgi:transcription termination factor Rho